MPYLGIFFFFFLSQHQTRRDFKRVSLSILLLLSLYCCMLLIWSLVSFYNHLPEAEVMTRWWGGDSGTYPIHSGMFRVFDLPQHRTLSTRPPLALRCMRSTGCWVSADERRYWKFLGFPPWVWTPASSAAGQCSTTRPLSCLNISMA